MEESKDFQTHRGFRGEHDHALKMGMPIFTLGDWKGCIK